MDQQIISIDTDEPAADVVRLLGELLRVDVSETDRGIWHLGDIGWVDPEPDADDAGDNPLAGFRFTVFLAVDRDDARGVFAELVRTTIWALMLSFDEGDQPDVARRPATVGA